MVIKRFRFLVLFVFYGYLLYAQDMEDNGKTKQLWLEYNPTYSLSEKVDLYADIGARTVSPNEWNRIVVGPSIRYLRPNSKYKKLYYQGELHAGIRFFHTYNKNISNRFEIRPFQGYKLNWPNRPRIVLQHYVRLEERFDFKASNWTSTFGLRARYRAKLILKYKGDWIPFNDGLYLPVSVEAFWNLKGDQQFNDVVRITPGIGYEFLELWRAELNFSYHYTRHTLEDEFTTNDFVFGLKVFHTLQKKIDNEVKITN